MKNLQKEQRLKHIISMKFIWFILLVICWLITYYLKYEFTNRALNGLLLLISASCFTRILLSEKYFILTGNRPSDKFKDGTFETYYAMHPKEAVYNKFLSILFIILVVFSLTLMISGILS